MLKVKFLDPLTDLPIPPDGFIKTVNRVYGYEAGDLELDCLARAIYKIVGLAAGPTTKGVVKVNDDHIDEILKSLWGVKPKFRAAIKAIIASTTTCVGDNFNG